MTYENTLSKIIETPWSKDNIGAVDGFFFAMYLFLLIGAARKGKVGATLIWLGSGILYAALAGKV